MKTLVYYAVTEPDGFAYTIRRGLTRVRNPRSQASALCLVRGGTR